jgi:hypothetical protein
MSGNISVDRNPALSFTNSVWSQVFVLGPSRDTRRLHFDISLRHQLTTKG